MKTARERFWPKVQQEESCWLWQGALHKATGFGWFGRGDRNVFAHWFAYESVVGQISDGFTVTHRCGNRRCVNPAHLFLERRTNSVRIEGDSAFLAITNRKGDVVGETIVDVIDLPMAQSRRWSMSGGYAVSFGGLRLHRLILNPPSGLDVDHINRNRLDNRRLNLRIATRAENVQNKDTPRNSSTGEKNVVFDRIHQNYRVQITVDGQRFTKARIPTYEAAVEIAREWRLSLHRFAPDHQMEVSH